jgi:hypothetical protein
VHRGIAFSFQILNAGEHALAGIFLYGPFEFAQEEPASDRNGGRSAAFQGCSCTSRAQALRSMDRTAPQFQRVVTEFVVGI